MYLSIKKNAPVDEPAVVTPVNNQQRLVGMEEIPLMVKSQENLEIYTI